MPTITVDRIDSWPPSLGERERERLRQQRSRGKLFEVPINPRGCPRQTQRDKWKKRQVIVRWHEYADNLRMMAKAQRFKLPLAGGRFEFRIAMPDSWSEKKKQRMAGEPHQSKPDLDNLLKGICDALLPGDDAKLWSTGPLVKVWARTGSVTIEAP